MYEFFIFQTDCGYPVSWSLDLHHIYTGYFFNSTLPFHPKAGKIHKDVHAAFGAVVQRVLHTQAKGY